MNTVTQVTRRRQAIIEYSMKKGVTAAARRYNVSRQFIYRWRNRYDGTLESLKDRSHRPHSHNHGGGNRADVGRGERSGNRPLLDIINILVSQRVNFLQRLTDKQAI